jgi:hypothetical protein
MRTTTICWLFLLLTSVVVPRAHGQQPTPHGEHEGGASPAPATLSPETRPLGRRLERLREQIHETNRWMVVHGSSEGLHGVGTEMAHAGEHLQELVRRLDEAYAEPAGPDAPSRGQLRAVHKQVDELEEQLGRTLAAVRAAVGYP